MENQNEYNNLLAELFSGSSSWTVNRKLVSKLGAKKAVFISNLIERNTDSNAKQEDWFPYTHADQAKDTGMSEYSVKKCKNYFIEKGVLETKMAGAEYYKINFKKIHELSK